MDAIRPISGLGGFASASMLLWGLAALAPIAIHLWSRRQYRTIAWAAMEPLLAAMRRHARRWRLEQWILLAVRVSILLLAACAWADPSWSRQSPRGGGVETGGGLNTHYVLVLDVSYSMAARAGQHTRFDDARSKAIDIVRAVQQGDGFTLVQLGQPPLVVMAEPTFDPEIVIAELQSLQVLHAGADLPATLGEVERILDQAGRNYPRLQRQRVVLLSDLGQSTWGAVESAAVQRSLTHLAERADVSLMDVGQTEVENAALIRLELRDPLVIAGRALNLEVEIQSFATRELPRRLLELWVDGQSAGEREISLPPNGRVTVNFTPRFETAGDHTLEVRLRDDDLDVDNVRWLSVPVRQRIRVLCVEGAPGAARYVALALDPSASTGVGLRIEPEVAAETQLAERELADYDAIVLCNVSRFDPAEASALRRFVRTGGGLVVFVGDQVQAENYQRLLGPDANGTPLLPARIGRVLPDGGGIDPLGYRHPLAAPFRGQTQAGLLNTPIWRYVELTPYDDSASRTALALSNGAPLVLDGRVERGRCLLFATAASVDSVDRSAQPPVPWTALPVWPSFVPLVQESLKWLLTSDVSTHNVDVGQPLVGLADARSAPGPWEVVGPLSSQVADAAAHRVELVDDQERLTWTYQPPQLSGLYEARWAGAERDSQWFAANVVTAESDLSRLDPALLPSSIGRSAFGDGWEAAGVVRSAPFAWYRILLLSVAGLLLVECICAWRFGGPRGNWIGRSRSRQPAG